MVEYFFWLGKINGYSKFLTRNLLFLSQNFTREYFQCLNEPSAINAPFINFPHMTFRPNSIFTKALVEFLKSHYRVLSNMNTDFSTIYEDSSVALRKFQDICQIPSHQGHFSLRLLQVFIFACECFYSWSVMRNPRLFSCNPLGLFQKWVSK